MAWTIECDHTKARVAQRKEGWEPLLDVAVEAAVHDHGAVRRARLRRKLVAWKHAGIVWDQLELVIGNAVAFTHEPYELASYSCLFRRAGEHEELGGAEIVGLLADLPAGFCPSCQAEEFTHEVRVRTNARGDRSHFFKCRSTLWAHPG